MITTPPPCARAHCGAWNRSNDAVPPLGFCLCLMGGRVGLSTASFKMKISRRKVLLSSTKSCCSNGVSRVHVCLCFGEGEGTRLGTNPAAACVLRWDVFFNCQTHKVCADVTFLMLL